MNKFIQGLLDCMFPPLCVGCNSKLVQGELLICTVCFSAFPETNFHTLLHNPVTDRLLGKAVITYGFSLYKLRRKSLLEQVLCAMKYKNKPTIAKLFGIQYGHILYNTPIRKSIDGILPLSVKEKQHNYLFAKGLSNVLNIPIYKEYDNLVQTKDHKTVMSTSASVKQRHLLLVDDIISTGSTLANYANIVLQKGAKAVSIATIAIVEDPLTFTVLN